MAEPSGGPVQMRLPPLPAAGESLRIGRDAANHLVLPSSEVSRFHAEIVQRAGFFHIKDCDSHNGTYVNGEPVKQSVQLQPGDFIHIGSFLFRFGGAALECTDMVSLGAANAAKFGDQQRTQSGPMPLESPSTGPLSKASSHQVSVRPAGDELMGRYQILHAIRRGGMGAVYRAYDRNASREVAIKEMRTDVSQAAAHSMTVKFLKEALILQRLEHPQIPRVWDQFTTQNSQFMVMEFIEGESLDALARDYQALTGAPVPHDLVIDYALQLCDILRYLHGNRSHPIVHRDIKPSNIILRQRRTQVVLVDFGLASQSNRTTMTAAGTLGYAPREQLKGHAEPRSDIYALGATMYYLLSGRDPIPLTTCNPLSVCRGLRTELAEVVEKATQQDPKNRYAHVGEMQLALRACLERPHVPGQAAAALPLPEPPLRDTKVAAASPPTVSFPDLTAFLRRSLSRLPIPRIPKKASVRDVAVFTTQLATLLRCGINMISALDTLRRQNQDTALSGPVSAVYQSLASGSSLSAAFSKQHATFSPMYVALLASGETYGGLDQNLGQMAKYLEKDSALRDRAKSALAYPLLILAITAVLTYFTVLFAVPPFMSILGGFNQRLPLPTQMLLAAVRLLRSPLWMLCALVAVAAACSWFSRILRQPQQRAALDEVLLRTPILGKFLRMVVLARISRCMATMLNSGVALDRTLAQAADMCAQPSYRASLLKVRDRMLEGEGLSESFLHYPNMYPTLFTGLVSAGEVAGRLPKLLAHAADLFELAVNQQLEVMLTLLEPLMMALCALIVGFIVLALFLPMAMLVTKLL